VWLIKSLRRFAAWAFVEAFATPQLLANAGKRRWEKFLHTHKLARPETYEKRLELFAKATEFRASDALTQAKSRLACGTYLGISERPTALQFAEKRSLPFQILATSRPCS
jgi:hypothetical protein